MPSTMSVTSASTTSSAGVSRWTPKVMLWFQRNTAGDFRVNIWRNPVGGYRIMASEEYPNRLINETVVDTYEEVCEYIDTLCRSTLMDRDHRHPITHFQYSIPNFPDVLVPIAQLCNETFYATFCDTLDYHLYRE